MTTGASDLETIRTQLDALDDRLVELLAERGALIEEVVRYKRANAMPVVDRAREDRMLARLASRADARGLDPRVVTTVVRAVIDAFTLVEVEELGEAAGSSGTAPS